MAKCDWRDKPGGPEICGLMAEASKTTCPRHTFMADLRSTKRDQKEQAKANGGSEHRPRSRAGLIQAGYQFTGTGECTGCNKRIEWWRTPKGNSAPFNPMPIETSMVTSHFATCTKANQFRRAS